MKRTMCVGFGETRGKCTNEVNPQVNPIWCESCNEERMKKLDEQFCEIMKQMRYPDTKEAPHA